MPNNTQNNSATAYLRGQSVKINPFRKKKVASTTPPPFPPAESMALTTPPAPEAGVFPLDALPPCIQGMVKKLSAKSSLPIAMIALSALSIASAAVGRKFSTKLSWMENLTLCNLIVLLGSPTASGKGILSKLLRAFLGRELNLLEVHQELRISYEFEMHLADERYSSLRKQIVKREADNLDCAVLRPLALKELSNKQTLQQQLRCRPTLCLRHPTGAALRDALVSGDQSIFMFSLDGASCLMDAINSKDRILRRYILSGFSGEETGDETLTQGKFSGEVCLSSLFAMQPHLLREMLFNEKAAHAGLLNRPLVIDGDFLDADTKELCSPSPTTENDWTALIGSLLDFRFAGDEALNVDWLPKAEKVFCDFDAETKSVLKDWPEDAKEHSGRVTELCVRLASLFLVVFHVHEGKNAQDESVQIDVAERAVELMRWIFRHRLRIQADAFSKFISSRATHLEKKLKVKGGSLLVSEIRDDHPQWVKHLDAIAIRYPNRFERGTRKPTRGPAAAAIFLLD